MSSEKKHDLDLALKMSQLLFEWEDKYPRDRSAKPNQDAQLYGYLIAAPAAIFMVSHGGNVKVDLTMLLAFFAMIIGGLVIVAGEMQLAERLRRAAKFCAKLVDSSNSRRS